MAKTWKQQLAQGPSASDLAEWWDANHKKSGEVLEEWVLDNPQWWAVGAAVVTASAQDLGAGMVDFARLGEGAAEGGWRGVGQDVLRLVGIVGPLGKGVKLTAKSTGVGINKILAVADPGGGICTYLAATHLLRRTGVRFFVSVRDLAKALNKPIPVEGIRKLSALDPVHTIQPLKDLGAKVTQLMPPRTIQDVQTAVRAGDGPVMFAIKWLDNGIEYGHAVYAFKNVRGQIRYSDRYAKVFDSIEGFQKNFKGTNYSVFSSPRAPMIRLEGMKMLETPGGFYTLALSIVKMYVANEDEVDLPTLVNSFEAKKKISEGRKPTLPQGAGLNSKKLRPVEYLTGVQARLNNLGYGAGPVDGINGPKTRRAVLLFQQQTPPLRHDSIPGPKTQAELLYAHGG